MKVEYLAICNCRCYIAVMIKNFRDTWLEKFFVDGVKNKKIPSIISERLFSVLQKNFLFFRRNFSDKALIPFIGVRKLQILDDSTCDVDLRSPPSNNFEKLTGKLKDRYSIRINDQWRLIFQWDNDRGEAENVYLNNHSYR